MEDIFSLDKKMVDDNMQDYFDNIVILTLKGILKKVENQKEIIDDLISASGNSQAIERAIMEVIVKHIDHDAEGKLAVTDYQPNARSKQNVYLYVGTHWELIDTQDYFDFTKAAAKKMGLDDLHAEDTRFMNLLFERLAFHVMHSRKQKVPRGKIWINLLNCTLEISANGDFIKRDHNPDDFFTYVLPYNYNPEAECPQWNKFLDRVLPSKQAQTLLAEYIGYCYTSNLKLEKMAVFYGSGSNGKSVALDVIEALMGRTNVSNVSLSDVTRDAEQRTQIEGKLVNISSESNLDLDYSVLKKLVSGEKVNVRVLYVGTHTISKYAKLITSFNKLPKPEVTNGFFRRWILFPFDVTIPDKEQDVNLTNKLKIELSGIFNWVLDALAGLLHRQAFSQSAVCNNALKDYKCQSNSVISFLTEKCKIEDGAQIKLSELYNEYTNFCRDEEIINSFGKKNFQEIIKNFGAKEKMVCRQIYYNIKIVKDEESDTDMDDYEPDNIKTNDEMPFEPYTGEPVPF